MCHDSLQKGQFSEVKPSHTHFWEPLTLFPTVTRARSKSHNTPNIECLTILFKKVCSVRSNPHKRTFENLRVSVFSRQLLVRVVNHTILLIRSVSRFYAKHQFSEVKPSHTHFSEPPSLSRQLLVRVVNHTLLLIRSVSRFSTIRSVQWGQTLTVALLRTSEFVSAVTRARNKSHTTPNTECVTILYKNQFSEVKPSHTHFWEPPSLSQ